MRALILAAGYGTRLQRDIDQSPTYHHLSGVPKPLLPIGNVPLISRWVKELQRHRDRISEILVVTNATNHHLFEDWARQFDNITLICDGSTTNETRSGAVAAIQLGASRFQCADDLIVVGGDTLFKQDFHLADKLHEFDSHPDASLLLSYNVDDATTKKCGILEVNTKRQVTAFLEKPGPEATHSRLGCPCFYILRRTALPHLETFLDEHMGKTPLATYDAPGNFIRYLIAKHACYASQISGRYDVGGLATYVQCNRDFAQPQQQQQGTTITTVALAALFAAFLRGATAPSP
ncbi:hypothetical protein PTSG_08298 [Salpingoeca rosetta]|uniref:Nucleotidyl transferase domain-containing protein n=1 Tax=Salpingoeca rosetta (strain ATCC 50818 / BSB-021) TaxID=946362 RepID=F2UJA7_SALR5|nr:uncharacterized protein PTSG_08298 [Salpingoeca rosetta]EGD77206.1 hypothetical protein PTSG_08298 [Salpingoeca rosetta]|eukprot:XP_004990550.1 hypothetical protein PTSG_08298 [Salpingoeca rosetta]